jgi:drug/metabolite transporter (DMT)-like permease
VRFLLAFLVLFPLVCWRDKGWSQFKQLTRRDWLGLFLLALFGQFLFTISLLYGLKLTGALEAGIITSASPALVTLLAFLFFREAPRGRQLAGVGLAVMGLLIINLWNLNGGASGHGTKIWGNFLILLAVFGESTFSLLRRMIRPEVSPMAISLALCLWGLVMFAPLALYEGWNFDFGGLNRAQWLSLLYFALIYTVLAYILWFRGVAHLTPSMAGVCTAMMPISGLTLSFLILGEPLGGPHLAGGALVLTAILVMNLNPARNLKPASPGGAPQLKDVGRD